MSEFPVENSIANAASYRSGTPSPVPFCVNSSDATGSSGYCSSSPSTPTSSVSISPAHTLKRSKSSSFRLINKNFSTTSNCSQLSQTQESKDDKLTWIIGWYPSFLFRIYLELFSICVCVLFKRLPIIIPKLWISACLWCFAKTITVALVIFKNILILIVRPASARNTQRRTVLISCGSSVQCVHLARNFSSAGARVVVCEVEGLFSLARYSTAVERYYTIPRPKDEQFDDYIEALKNIVVRENVEYFIPICESSSAYYDALAKPHIEVLGCHCICPDVNDVLLLDDLVELMRKIQSDQFLTPNYYSISSSAELNMLYHSGIVKREPHFMVNTGVEGCKYRIRVDLPKTERKLTFNRIISKQNPWLVVQDCVGEKFMTCTTVRDSRVICNVICMVEELDGLVPIEKPEIEQWICQFFAGLATHRKIVGHFSFCFTIPEKTGFVVLTDCRVGVRLPYICYTSVQSRILLKPCKHFSRYTSGPIVTQKGKYWFHRMVIDTLEHPSNLRIRRLIRILWHRTDALFTASDPLPYCAYYYLQLPLSKINTILNRVDAQY